MHADSPTLFPKLLGKQQARLDGREKQGPSAVKCDCDRQGLKGASAQLINSDETKSIVTAATDELLVPTQMPLKARTAEKEGGIEAEVIDDVGSCQGRQTAPPRPDVFAEGAGESAHRDGESPAGWRHGGVAKRTGCDDIVEAETAEQEAFWLAAQKALQARAAMVRKDRVQAFLRENGFSGVNTAKGWLFYRCYPLHVAVQKNDAEMVRLLLESNALRKVRDSKGMTPRSLAKQRNIDGSHAEVLAEFAKRRQKRIARRLARSTAAAVALANGAPDDTEPVPDIEDIADPSSSCARAAPASAQPAGM